jgi:Domain of unknown function (DUF5615)
VSVLFRYRSAEWREVQARRKHRTPWAGVSQGFRSRCDDGLGPNLQGITDQRLFDVCAAEGRALTTLDRDFGEVLRFPPETVSRIIILDVGPRMTRPSHCRSAERLPGGDGDYSGGRRFVDCRAGPGACPHQWPRRVIAGAPNEVTVATRSHRNRIVLVPGDFCGELLPPVVPPLVFANSRLKTW